MTKPLHSLTSVFVMHNTYGTTPATPPSPPPLQQKSIGISNNTIHLPDTQNTPFATLPYQTPHVKTLILTLFCANYYTTRSELSVPLSAVLPFLHLLPYSMKRIELDKIYNPMASKHTGTM